MPFLGAPFRSVTRKPLVSSFAGFAFLPRSVTRKPPVSSFAGFALSPCNLSKLTASSHFVILQGGTAHCHRVHYTKFSLLRKSLK